MVAAIVTECLAPVNAVDDNTKEVLDGDAPEEEPLEVDYDTNDLTYLYQAIQDKAFLAVIDFLEDPSKQKEVRAECRTWVTRYEEKKPNKIRWSHLPLHAALLFKAPTRVVELLMEKYPKAVRCTNDQQMLPLHLAFRYGASDAVFLMILKEFPEAMQAGDHKTRLPLDHAKDGETAKRGEIIKIYVDDAKKEVLKMKQQDQMLEVEKMMEEKESKIQELEKSNKELKDAATKAKDDYESLMQELAALKKSAATAVAQTTSTVNTVAKTATKTATKTASTASAAGTKPKSKRGIFGRK